MRTDAHSAEIAAAAVRRFPLATILCIAFAMPDWLYGHRGRIALVAAAPPCKPFASSDLHYVHAGSVPGIARAVSRIRTGWAEPCDLLFVDHDHALSSLLGQLDAAAALVGEQTVMVFDAAVPVTIGMAGARPTQDWWVGEVWMLRHLLQPRSADSYLETCDAAPVGLLVARNVALPGVAAAAEAYRRLSAVNTDAELDALSHHVAPEALAGWLAGALGAGAGRHWMTLDVTGIPPADIGSRRILDAADDAWAKPGPEFVADLSTHGFDLAPFHVTEARRHGKVLDTFQDAWVVGCNSVITPGRFFDRNYAIGTPTIGRMADGIGTAANEATLIERDGAGFRIPSERLRLAATVPGHTLFGSADEPDNYGMWLLFGLPTVRLFLDQPGSFDRFMARLVHPWQRQVLLDAGLREADLAAHVAEEPVRFERVSLIRHSWRDLAVTPGDRAIYAGLADRFRGNAPGAERIFVSRLSRTRNGAYRGLVNEAEVIDQVTALGFTVIEPELLTFPQQVAAFAAAKVVVGLGGAGLFNTVFCRPGTLVVTLEGSMQFAPSHANLFASNALRYGVMLGEADPADPSPEQRRWRIDAGAVAAKLRAVL